MSIEMQTGTQVEVTCDSDAGLYAGMQGSGSYVLDKPLEISMPDTNTVTVGPGHILQNGFHVWLKGATEFTIPSGVQAQKRSIVIGFRSTKTRDEETMETIIRSDPLVLSGEPTMDGTPEDPEWIEGNLNDGDTIADFPICRVVTDGINALEPVPMYQVLASAAEMQQRWDSLSQEVDKVKGNGIKYEDVLVTVKLMSGDASQNKVQFNPSNANASNLVGKQIVRVWPLQFWTHTSIQAITSPVDYKEAWNKVTMATTLTQNYDVVCRFYYMDKSLT